jgi:hypothetical protein
MSATLRLLFWFVVLLVCIYTHLRFAKKIHRSLCEYREAENQFYAWREKNPGVYLGLSDQGKAILRNYIDKYVHFLNLHPFVDGNGHIDYLMSLFDDFPPDPNKPWPKASRSEAAPAAPLFLSSTNPTTPIHYIKKPYRGSLASSLYL